MAVEAGGGQCYVRSALLFQGRRYDAESGLYDFRARMQDPQTGIFLSRDPMGYYDSMNLYGFVNNNPVCYRDPSGKFFVQIAIGAVVGAVIGGVSAAIHHEDILEGAIAGAAGGAVIGLTGNFALGFATAGAVMGGIKGYQAGGLAGAAKGAAIGGLVGFAAGATFGVAAGLSGSYMAAGAASGVIGSILGDVFSGQSIDAVKMLESGAEGAFWGGLFDLCASRGWGPPANKVNMNPFSIKLPRPVGPMKPGAGAIESNLPRPEGIPADWIVKPSKTGGGIRYIDPKNPHNSVRVMPGDPDSPFPNSRQPYVRHLQHGQSLDVHGNVVPKNTPDAHIPLRDFHFSSE